MLNLEHVEHYHTEGYFVLDAAVPTHLLEPLRDAANRVVRRARGGAWPHCRSAGDGDIWGLSHLLHPDLDEPIFAEYMTNIQRETLHCCMGLKHGALRRPHIYENLKWMDGADFAKRLPARLVPLHANFREMAACYRSGATSRCENST